MLLILPGGTRARTVGVPGMVAEGSARLELQFLPMGCKISCSLFEKFANFLHWLVACMAGRITMDHYLDDFKFLWS